MPAAPKRKLPKGTVTGYVYFASPEDQDVMKIGFSKEPRARMAGVNTGSHQEITLDFCFATYREAEKMIHRRFAADRLRGEWFKYTRALAEFIDDLDDVGIAGHLLGEGDYEDVFIDLETVDRLLRDLYVPEEDDAFEADNAAWAASHTA